MDANAQLARIVEVAVAPFPTNTKAKRRPRKPKAAKHDGGKAQIAARVAEGPKPNPNAPKSKPYKEDSPGFMRAKLGITMTEITKRINEPNAIVTVMLDENGAPTGEETTVEVKPNARLKRLRRASFEARGLLGPFADANTRRKTRRRNGRYAAVNTKGTKPSKKKRATGAPVGLPSTKAKKN